MSIFYDVEGNVLSSRDLFFIDNKLSLVATATYRTKRCCDKFKSMEALSTEN